MPQPTASQVHAVNVPLSNISTAYIQSESNYIARRVFPIVPVDKRSDAYYTYTKADFMRDEAQVRAGGTESAGSGYGLSTATYSCDVFALHKDIDDFVRGNADAAINPDRDATLWLTDRMLLRLEKQWAADYFVTGIWGTSATPSSLWSDYAASDPVNDVKTARVTILKNTGKLPNTLVLSFEVYETLRNHPDIIDRIKYTQFAGTKNITPDLLAAIFDVERVLVCMAVNNTAVEGETAVQAFVHGKHALLCYAAPSPSLLTPSAGYMFSWRGLTGMGIDMSIKRFRMEQLAADRIEAQMAFDLKLVGSDLGYFLESVIS